jgi:hypothetical protein
LEFDDNDDEYVEEYTDEITPEVRPAEPEGNAEALQGDALESTDQIRRGSRRVMEDDEDGVEDDDDEDDMDSDSDDDMHVGNEWRMVSQEYSFVLTWHNNSLS